MQGSFLPIFGLSFTTVLFIPPSFSDIFPSTRLIAVSSRLAPVTFVVSVLSILTVINFSKMYRKQYETILRE